MRAESPSIALGSDASYFDAALLLGLCQGEAVVAWADGVIAALDDPPHALHEVALTDAADLTALRRAVQPLVEAHHEPAVMRRLLSVAAADLAQGRRDVTGTVQVLAQMRRMLALSPRLERDLDHLQDTHMLAVAGVQGSPEAAEALVRGWLAGYSVAVAERLA